MKTTRIAGYIRVSTEQQADGGVSLEAQRAKLEAYAGLYELELVEVVVDAAVSAKTLRRPGLARALAMLEGGAADGLLVAKLDRLTRSVKDLGILLESYFSEGRHQLLSVSEQIDTRTAGGRLVLNILGSVSQWEREKVGERTREALGYLRGQGVRLGGEALGWRRGEALDADGRRIVEAVEEEAATVERILSLQAEGLTVREIATAMNAGSLHTKRGGRWHPTTVQRVLSRARVVA